MSKQTNNRHADAIFMANTGSPYFARFKALVDIQKSVTDAELEALIRSEMFQPIAI